MDFILFICWEDELQWLGRVPRLDFVMSEEELLLGQVSLALLGLSNALSVLSLRTVHSSDGPELGLPIIFLGRAPHIISHNFFQDLLRLERYYFYITSSLIPFCILVLWHKSYRPRRTVFYVLLYHNF